MITVDSRSPITIHLSTGDAITLKTLLDALCMHKPLTLPLIGKPELVVARDLAGLLGLAITRACCGTPSSPLDNDEGIS